MSINNIAAEVRRLLAKVEGDNSIVHIVGNLLIEAKKEAGHGKWSPFLKEAGINDRTAQVYMKVAGKLNDTPEDVRPDLLKMPLRELAKAASTPKEKVKLAIVPEMPAPTKTLNWVIVGFDDCSDERDIIELSVPVDIIDECRSLKDSIKLKMDISRAIRKALAGNRTKGKPMTITFRGQTFKSKAKMAQWVEENFGISRASVEAMLNLDKLRSLYSGWNLSDAKLLEFGMEKLDERITKI
jgi:hypothetical protein